MADVQLNTLGASVLTALNTLSTVEIDADVVVNGDFSNPSDARIKTDVQPIEPVLEKVLQLVASSYTKTTTGRNEVGFIAQEVEKVFPHLVGQRKVGEYEDFRELQMLGFMPIAIKAIQELHAIVQAQAAEIEQLKGNPHAQPSL